MALAEAKIEGSIGTICLDHFEKRNALCETMADEIIQTLENFEKNRVRVAILRARPGVKI